MRLRSNSIGSVEAEMVPKWLWQRRFLDRFQLLVWPDVSPVWEYVDEPPDSNAEQLILDIFVQIVGRLEVDKLIFRFSPEAQEYFQAWITVLERRIRRPDETDKILCAHLSKYRSLMPSLACLFWLSQLAAKGFEGFEGAKGLPPKSLRCAEAAAQWCSYLESHAKRIYSSVLTGAQPAQILSQQILNRRLGTHFTLRDIKQKDWKGLKEDTAIQQALAILTAKNWLRPECGEQASTGGRPTTRFHINPKVWCVCTRSINRSLD